MILGLSYAQLFLYKYISSFQYVYWIQANFSRSCTEKYFQSSYPLTLRTFYKWSHRGEWMWPNFIIEVKWCALHLFKVTKEELIACLLRTYKHEAVKKYCVYDKNTWCTTVDFEEWAFKEVRKGAYITKTSRSQLKTTLLRQSPHRNWSLCSESPDSAPVIEDLSCDLNW